MSQRDNADDRPTLSDPAASVDHAWQLQLATKMASLIAEGIATIGKGAVANIFAKWERAWDGPLELERDGMGGLNDRMEDLADLLDTVIDPFRGLPPDEWPQGGRAVSSWDSLCDQLASERTAARADPTLDQEPGRDR